MTTYTSPRAIFRRMFGIALGALLVLSAVAFVYRARDLFLLFGAALALAAAARPVADGFMRRGIGRVPATAIAYVAGLVLVGSFAAVMFGTAFNEVGPAGGHLLRRYELLLAELADGGHLAQLLASILPRPDASGVVSRLLPPSEAGSAAFTVTSFALEVFVSAILVVVFSLYWGKHRPHAIRLFLSLIPATQRTWVRQLIEDIDTSVGTLILNEGLKSMLVSVVLALLFRLLGLPFPTVPALVIGLLRVVPLAGKALGLVVAVVAAAPAGPFALVAAPSLTLAASLTADRVCQRLLSCREMNPLLGIFMAVVTWNLLGWWGLLLAPPLSATLQTGLETVRALRRTGGPHVPAGWDEIVDRQDQLFTRARAAPFPIPRATAALLRRLEELMRVIREPDQSTASVVR